MALPKKKLVKKVLKKKLAVADKAEPATKKKKVVKKAPASKAAIAKKAVVKKKSAIKKGKYPYEPYRAKKNVGNAAKNALLQGKDTIATLDAVKEAFPECNITKASVGYYKNALRKEGYDY